MASAKTIGRRCGNCVDGEAQDEDGAVICPVCDGSGVVYSDEPETRGNVAFTDPSGGKDVDENGMPYQLTALDGLVTCEWWGWSSARHDANQADYQTVGGLRPETYTVTKHDDGSYSGDIPTDGEC